MTRKEQTTTQKLARLRELASHAGKNVFERIRLCAEVLDDMSWLSRTHDGVRFKAEQALEDEYFPDLKSYVGLGICLAIYQRFPEESTWSSHHYQLGAMHALYEEARSEEEEEEDLEPLARTNWKERALDEQEGREVAESRLTTVITTVEEQRQEIARLQKRIEELTAENHHLRGRLEEIEKRYLVTAN